MRVFGVSDLHVDYAENLTWVEALSQQDYQADVVLVAGDISHKLELTRRCLALFQERFAHVLFVAGNHDLWLTSKETRHSIDKFDELQQTLDQQGIVQEALYTPQVSLVPLQSWYDYSFGEPDTKLRNIWVDYRRCRWPNQWEPAQVAEHFSAMNPDPNLRPELPCITFSHFMPRMDLLPPIAVKHFGFLLPILGSAAIDEQLRQHQPQIHLYGHSHVNVDKTLDGIRYINNARGYPKEPRHESRRLLQLL